MVWKMKLGVLDGGKRPSHGHQLSQIQNARPTNGIEDKEMRCSAYAAASDCIAEQT